MRNDFTLFLRKYPNGSKVFFYYAYDENGQRCGPWTTKSVNRTAAKKYCHRLFKDGTLLPDKNRNMTFGEYAKGFWERGSMYIKYQESRADITDTYINNCRKMLHNQILPFFENVPLNKITAKDVNNWLLGFKERNVEKDGKTEIVRYQNTYANTVFGTFNVMLAEAVRQELLTVNPCEKVKRLKNDRKQIEILTVEEVQKLFQKNYKAVWGEKTIAYAVCRLASLTGMRIGEILGLRGEYVFDKYIHICGQYGDEGYKPYTKTKENRNIPLLPEIIAFLRGFNNGTGFVFSLTGGAVPVTQPYVRSAFHQALIKIGINKTEISRRGLTIHSWRHFLNTELLKQGLTVTQVQSVTGHKSEKMTDRYNHPTASQSLDVMNAQAAIAGIQKPEKETQPKKAGKTQKKQQGLTLVKTSELKSA